MRTAWLVPVVVLAWAAAAIGEGKPEAGIPWRKTIAEARKDADGKRPIAVVLVQKGCPLSAEWMRTLPKDERVTTLAAGMAWLLIQVGSDEYREWFVKTCGGNVEGAPSLLFLNPKGENADPAYAGIPTVTSADPDEVVPVLREVWQRAKREEPEGDRAAVQAAIERARAAKLPADAIRSYQEAIRAGAGWSGEAAALEQAQTALEALLQAGNAEMLRIVREVRDDAAIVSAYEAVKANYAGTAIADWAGEELARRKGRK